MGTSAPCHSCIVFALLTLQHPPAFISRRTAADNYSATIQSRWTTNSIVQLITLATLVWLRYCPAEPERIASTKRFKSQFRIIAIVLIAVNTSNHPEFDLPWLSSFRFVRDLSARCSS
ncbi:hypothetical protein PCASD_19624 [Puccinia coronata f. sp. avenae]|uniref:Uncharacterized protein n=1 Tax=Puccinia coronata f. sp. avenae TaxID=200324 RepID=A0A2N5TU06_9BASI|nr:hypothetical protein PCASD_19624 [Puccinia coronata f. sp. avenae]